MGATAPNRNDLPRVDVGVMSMILSLSSCPAELSTVRRTGAVRFDRTTASMQRVAPTQVMCGYRWSVGGTNVSLIARGDTQRSRFQIEPALSFVPEARAPPNGCCPTTAPVGLSLT